MKYFVCSDFYLPSLLYWVIQEILYFSIFTAIKTFPPLPPTPLFLFLFFKFTILCVLIFSVQIRLDLAKSYCGQLIKFVFLPIHVQILGYSHLLHLLTVFLFHLLWFLEFTKFSPIAHICHWYSLSRIPLTEFPSWLAPYLHSGSPYAFPQRHIP